MKAVGYYKPLAITEDESLLDLELEKPQPSGHDLLVRIKAVSVNPVDVKVRKRAREDTSVPAVMGWDAAGIVEAVGSEVSLFREGDEVFYAGDHFRQGTDAEYHLVDERLVGKKPANLSFEEAAAMPLTTITAWESLFERLGISRTPAENKGKSVLIIGGAGGVGSIAAQIAKRVAGLTVISTASRPESEQWCRKMGADYIINHRKPFLEEFKRIGIEDVNYILCFNSTEMHIRNMADVIRPQGRICAIAETKDNLPIDINLFQLKSVGFMWELMFTRSIFKTDDMIEQHRLLNEVSRLLDEGMLETTMTEQFGELNAANLKKAHARVETGSMVGKLVLSV